MSLRSLSSTTASPSSTTVCYHSQLLLAMIIKRFSGQEQGYTGSYDPANREA